MVVEQEDNNVRVPRPASPIEFRLDLASGVPTYLQLVHQVEHALRLGYLVLGDQLPKVRDVVADLAINPNTVLKAYKELETKGIAVGRPGQGTFIIEAALKQVRLPELTELRRSLVSWLADADAAGLDEDGIAALVANVLRDFRESRASRAASQAHLLVRGNGTFGPVPLGWEAHSVTLEELALTYLREPAAVAFPGPACRRDAELRVVGN